MRLSERSEFQNIVKKVNKPVPLTLRIVVYLNTPQFQISPSSPRIVLHQHVQSHSLPVPHSTPRSVTRLKAK